MDLIAIDIGNSNVSLAVFAKGKLDRTEHIAVSGTKTGQLVDILKAFREICGPQPLGARTVPIVVCSVNQKILDIVEIGVNEALDQRILLLGRDFPLEMKVAVENPESVGSDRLVTAFAAYCVIESAVVVADFGTATTIDLVNDNGIFLGGVIMPGLATAAKSLKSHTAMLPEVTPKLPTGEYGINTITAIENGIYYSAIGALREMVERYAMELGHWPQVVAAGGYASLIAQKSEIIDSIVPDLCLDGLYLAYQQFCRSGPTEEGL